VLYADSADGTLIAYRVFAPLPNVGETARHADERGLTRRVGADAPTVGDDGEADASGEPVLLVHGFASNGRVTWEGTGWVSALTDAGRTAITVDLRGHGASDKPAEASAYDPAALGDDLVAVLDSADVDRVDVIAYSMGNRVLSAFATAAPERVRRAVVGGAGPDELFASWDLDEARALLLRDEPVATVLIEQVLRPAIDAGADREALLACIEGVAGAPLALPGGLPVLFVAGERDPVPTGVEAFAAARGSDVLRIPGRDHVSTLTSREFKTAALAFLA
jgi:pimeloyl-ACP methyl ester carboxylesterase